MPSLGTIGPLDTDMYQKVDDELCKCRWCGWNGRQHNLPRSAHERSLAHRAAARARGIELPRPVRVHNRPIPPTTQDDIHRQIEPPKERPPRKLPKPKCDWNKRQTDRAEEWLSDLYTRGKKIVGTRITTLRVVRVGVEGDEKRYIAYHGLKHVGSEDTLERAQALAEHPELE